MNNKLNKKALIAFGLAGVLLVTAIILGNQMHSDDSFSETYLFPQAGEGSAVFFWAFLVLMFIAIRFLVKESNNQINNNVASDNSAIETEVDRIRKQYDEKCKKIYNKYINEGYDINDDMTNEIIGKSYDIPKEELIKLYYNGEKVIKEEKIIALNKKMTDLRTKELEISNKDKEESTFYGKNKYLRVLNERLEGVNAIKELSRIMSNSYVSGAVQARNVRQSDPYILGGMAEGIAGPGAGIMTASRVQAENERRKLEGEITAQNSLKSATRWAGEEKKAGRMALGLERIIGCINEALIIDDINQLQDKIKFTNIDYKILETNNFNVSVEYVLEDLKILNKDGLLDGSFKVDVLDESENVVATGYYNGGNVEINDDNSVYTFNMGLNNGEKFSVICIANDSDNINSQNKYHVELEPIHLWILEKKW